MTITLYSISCAPNKLDKSNDLGQGTQIDNVKPTADCDMLAPTLELNWSSSLSGFNYAYIDTFGRYYFINDIAARTGQRCIMSLSVDALNTYASSIKECYGTAIRSESEGKTFIPDSKYPVNKVEKSVDMLNFNTPFSASSVAGYIITTIGGNA